MLNYAVIGYGSMAEFHIQRLSSFPEFCLKGIYDIAPIRNAAARDKGLPVYSGLKQIVNDKNVDAVLIAAPNDVHVSYAELFANAGKHILCEKPAALNCEEYERMEKAAQANRVILSVHQNRRWDKDFLTICDILRGGQLGKINRIESNVCGSNGIPGDWRKERKYGGGMMLDWGVHLIDQACRIYPEKILSLYCTYSYAAGFEAEDAFHLEMKFENGVSYCVQVETNTFIPVPRWIIKGEHGTAIIENWGLDGKIVFKRENNGEITGEKAGNGFTKTMAARPPAAIEAAGLPEIIVDEDAFYINFYNACVKGIPQYVKHTEVKRVLSIMEAAYISATKNEVVKMKL